MNENLRFVLALAVFLALVASLELVAGYAVYHALESEEKQDLIEILTPQVELLAEIGLLLLLVLGIAFAAAYRFYVKGSLKIA